MRFSILSTGDCCTAGANAQSRPHSKTPNRDQRVRIALNCTLAARAFGKSLHNRAMVWSQVSSVRQLSPDTRMAQNCSSRSATMTPLPPQNRQD